MEDKSADMASSIFPCGPDAFWMMNRSDVELAVAVCDCRSRLIGVKLTDRAVSIEKAEKVEIAMVTSKPVTIAAFVIRELRIRLGNNLLVKPAKGRPMAIRKRLATAAF